ncbi:unnamed protein product [Cunninghamella blakesleeana]
MAKACIKQVGNIPSATAAISQIIHSLKTLNTKRVDHFVLKEHCYQLSKYWKRYAYDSFKTLKYEQDINKKITSVTKSLSLPKQPILIISK